MANIATIEGIAAVNAKKLAKANILTVSQLLDACGAKKGRKTVSKETGLEETKLLKWVNHADLCRIKGIAGQYAELLEASGVDTVKALAKRSPKNLHEKLVATNTGRKKRLVKQNPSLSKVEGWVTEAKTPKPAVSH